jgi:hypothetical protein
MVPTQPRKPQSRRARVRAVFALLAKLVGRYGRCPLALTVPPTLLALADEVIEQARAPEIAALRLSSHCSVAAAIQSVTARRARAGSPTRAWAPNTAICVSAEVPAPAIVRQRSNSGRQPSAAASAATSSIT